MKIAFLHGSNRRANGDVDTLWVIEVPAKYEPMPHHKRGLSYTATGYGRRLPTTWMVKFNGRWQRVYCCIFSNAGTCYIGRLTEFGERVSVEGGEL